MHGCQAAHQLCGFSNIGHFTKLAPSHIVTPIKRKLCTWFRVVAPNFFMPICLSLLLLTELNLNLDFFHTLPLRASLVLAEAAATEKLGATPPNQLHNFTSIEVTM
jgi:hypothetical protein